MSRDPINPHGFDEYRLAHEAKQKAVDRILQYQTDTRQRVDTLVRAVFVLSGGALTISIGIFLRAGAPHLSAHLTLLLQVSWWLLFFSLTASAGVLFIMICQGYWFTSLWGKSLENGNSRNVDQNPLHKFAGIMNWVIGVSGFFAFVVGLGVLAYVSVNAVTVSPNLASSKDAPKAVHNPP